MIGTRATKPTARAPLRVIALALAAGAAGALAFPPFGVLPGIAGFGLLMRLLDDSRAVGNRRAALIGWLAGLSYFLISTWWVGEAFLVDVAAHGWQAPFAVLLLGGGLGLIWSGAALVYRRIAPSSGARLLVFAFVFSGAEWLRGHILTGFPWDLPGEVFRAGSALSQGAAVFGAYGMTFLTLLIGGSAGLIGWPLPRGDRVGLALGATVLMGLYGWGALRLSSAPPLGREADGVRVRIVQADIPQTEKWSEAALQSIVLNYTSLTAAPAPRQPDVVVWPEGAVPLTVDDLMSPEAWTSKAVLGALRPGQFLVFGSTRLEPAPSSGGRPRYFNSLIAMRRTATGAERVGVYDKHHLVPFGEYMPLDALSTRLGLKALAHVYDGFTSGPRPEPLEATGLGRFQPLICYESLFPSTFALSGARPEWIVNVSNDAWFGDTSGPWQHLNLASYRAIEEGLPLVRATPTGVSAMIDGYGRPLAELPIGRRGVLDIGLPKALPPTLYTRWRDWPFLAFLVIGALGAVVKPRPRRRGSKMTAEETSKIS